MNKNLILVLLVGGALWYFTQNKSNLTTDQKRSAILDYVMKGGDSQAGKIDFQQKLNSFFPAEVSAVFTFIFDYITKGRRLTPGTALYADIEAISTKYNIFT